MDEINDIDDLINLGVNISKGYESFINDERLYNIPYFVKEISRNCEIVDYNQSF
jgi:hypothetical protein